MNYYRNSNTIANFQDYIHYYKGPKQKTKNMNVWKQDLSDNKPISKPINLLCLFFIIMALNL